MKIKTAGIILRYFRYGDNGMIAHIYTQAYGRQAFIFKGGSTRNAKRKMNFLQPLSLVEIPIDYRPQKELYLGNGTQSLQTFQTIPFQQTKSSIAFFLAEVLSKVLHLYDADEQLFQFLKEAVFHLDKEETKGTNFHLCFLIKLTEYLGIQPMITNEKNSRFLNINYGEFRENEDVDSLSEENSELWKSFQKKPFYIADEIALSRQQRNELLQHILKYYTYHLQDLENLKSLDVLQEIFQ